MPPQQGQQQGQQVPASTIVIARLLYNALISAAGQGNPQARTILNAAVAADRPLKLRSMSSISDLQYHFGDINTLIQVLVQAGVIPPTLVSIFTPIINQELDYIKYAAKIVEQPELKLQYRNMMPIFDKDGEMEDFIPCTPGQLASERQELLNKTDAVNQKKLQQLNKLNNIPIFLDKDDIIRFHELMRASIRANQLPQSRRQGELDRVQRSATDFESKLIHKQRHIFYSQRRMRALEIQVPETEKRLEDNPQKLQTYRETQAVKESILENLQLAWAGDQPNIQVPQLHSLSDTPPLTANARQTIGLDGLDSLALRLSGLVKPNGEVNREAFKLKLTGRKSPEVRGTELAVNYSALVRGTYADINRALNDVYNGFLGENQYLRNKVSEAVAMYAAQKVANIMVASLEGNKGMDKANDEGRIYDRCLDKDPNIRAELGKVVIQTLAIYDPNFAQNAYLADQIDRATAYADGAMDGITNRKESEVVDIKLEVRSAKSLRRFIGGTWGAERNVIYATYRYEVPDKEGHIVRGVEHKAFGPSVLDVTKAFNDAHKLGKWTEEQALRVNEAVFGPTRAKHLASQELFAKLALDTEKQVREDPLGFALRSPLLIAWHYAPESLRKSSFGTRAALIAVGGWPFIGPLAAGAGLSHGAQLFQEEIRKRSGLLLDPFKTFASYTEGFAATALLGLGFNPLFKRDLIGRPTFGIHLIPAGWNVFADWLGLTALRAYDKKFLSLGTEDAKQYSDSLGGSILRGIGLRWKDANKRRDPISLFIIGPLWEITKALTLKALEVTGLSPALVSFLKGSKLGNLSAAWSYGGGWADITRITTMQNAELSTLFKDVKPFTQFVPGTPALPRPLTFNLNIAPELQSYLNQQDAILAKYSRFHRIGNIVKGSSGFWSGLKIFAGGALRFISVAGLTMLITGSPTTALLFSGAFTGGWALRQVLTTPVFGGFFEWTQVGKASMGVYHATGLLSNVPFWGKFAEVLNTPIFQITKIENISSGAKALGGFLKILPIDGIIIGFLLSQLGIPPIIAWGLPVGIDLGMKALKEIQQMARFQKFFASVGPWAQATGILGSIFNIGTLAYSLELGGIFDVFSHFSIQNLLKFVPVPATYFSILGTMAAFGAGTTTLVFGMPAFIAAGVITGGLIITDVILRALGVTYGIFTPFKFIVDQVWNFLKTQGFDFAAGAVSTLVGLFGLVQSAIRGDIQGVAISLILMAIGGVLVATSITSSAFPSSYYTPTEAAEADVHENAYITNAFKDFKRINDTKDQLTYEYKFSIEKFNDNDIKSITISENDIFNNLQADDIVRIDDQIFEKKSTLGKVNLVIPNQTFSGSSYVDNDIKIQREFTITLTKPINEIVGDDGEICNMLWITIDKVEKNDGTTYKPLVTDITHSICIDINGNITDTGSISGEALTNLPIDPAKVSFISSCFLAKSKGFHGGIDFAATEGTEIYSPADGTVKEKYYQNDPNIPDDYDFKSLGNLIIIKHNMNKTTVYGHLSGFGKDDLGDTNELEVGDKVSAGQVIAYAGNTGNSKGYHLHFMTKDDSGFYNPCLETNLNICNGTYNYQPGYLEGVHGEGVDKCSSTPSMKSRIFSPC